MFLLKSKTVVYDTFVRFHKYVQTQFGYFIKALQCDNGREYDNDNFTLFSLYHGMIYRYSCPHTSSQIGKAERMIRTINNVCRSLLFHASLPSSYWVESLHTASYLLNICSTRLLGNLTPVHILYNRALTYNHIRTFGCLCYPNVFATASNKMSPRSTPCIFLRYPLSYRGYRCLDIQTKKIIISRHVVFDESAVPYSSNYTPQLSDFDFLLSNEHTTPPSLLIHSSSPTQPPNQHPFPDVGPASPGQLTPFPSITAHRFSLLFFTFSSSF